MLENIKTKEFPKESGVYFIKVNNEIVYVGSSSNLYQRMGNHKRYIKQGSAHGCQTDFYQFLQSNQFTVEFQLETNYKQLEQKLIEQHNPTFNSRRAFTGLGARKGRGAEYDKERYQKYKEEIKQYQKQHYESHKEEIKQQKKQYRESHKEHYKKIGKQYRNQLCNYNGEILTLDALRCRFKKKGIEHPTIEAKKYLI